MKIKILFSLFLLSAEVVVAQNAIDFDYSNKKMIFQPLRQQLTKENRYALQMPSWLSYYRSEDEILAEIWNPFTSLLPIKAKLHQAKPDIRIDIIAPGMSGLSGQSARWLVTEVFDQNHIPRPVKGYVRDFTCNFPCVLRIRDAQGKTIDSIELASKEEKFTVTMHRDLLLASNRPEYPKDAYPFLSEKELVDAETLYKEALAKKIEQMVAYKVFQRRVWLAVNFLFNQYNTQKQTYGWGFVKTKNRVHDFSDLDKAVLDYRAALDSLEAGRHEACERICSGLKQTYSSMLQSGEPRIDKGVRQILYYNLAHVSLLSNDFESARKYYNDFIQSGAAVEGSRIASELKGRIELFEVYYQIKKSIHP